MTLQTALSTDHLIVRPGDDVNLAALADDWVWLIGADKRVILVAACGNLFVEDSKDGTIQYLDVSKVQLLQVAETAEEFNYLVSQSSFIETYLAPERIETLRCHGLHLGKNQVYSFSVPLSMGGQDTVENTEVADLEVHYSVAGQIERQIFDVPVGTPIGTITITNLPTSKPWWKFW